MAARDIIIETIKVNDIFIVGDRRPVDQEAVESLSRSISQIGLQYPVTIRYVEHLIDPDEGELHGAYVLVAGRHRLEAVRSLNHETISAVVVRWDERTARKWEIAENLHRADLSELQRKEQTAEWIAIVDAEAKEGVSRQPAAKPQGGRPEGGIRAAARELGIDEREARRANKIASISEQAKEAAVAAHLDNNQAALLKVANAEPERQVEVVNEIAQAKALKVQQDVQNRAATEIAEILVAALHADGVEAIRVNLAVTTTKAIIAALANLLGESIMDRRHG